MTAINQQNDTVKRMAEAWAVIDPLMGGTQAMRKAGKKLLPQQPREDDEDYEIRQVGNTEYMEIPKKGFVISGHGSMIAPLSGTYEGDFIELD